MRRFAAIPAPVSYTHLDVYKRQEVTYPFEDEVAIILNESGKINGLPLNRAIYTEDGDMQDLSLIHI